MDDATSLYNQVLKDRQRPDYQRYRQWSASGGQVPCQTVPVNSAEDFSRLEAAIKTLHPDNGKFIREVLEGESK